MRHLSNFKGDFKADLHTHSSFSDGTFTPQELVELAFRQGYQGLSICDHDAIDAYSVAFKIAQDKGVYLIPGVEISASHDGVSVHILGYGYNPESSILQDGCIFHRERRRTRNLSILEKLHDHGMPLDELEIINQNSNTITYGRPHIALAMVKRGYVQDVQEAFRMYLGSGKSCYSPGENWTIDEAISLIHDAGGLAVIAHPHIIRNDKIVEALLKKNFDGIEGYYCKFKKNECARWLKVASTHRWLVTGGSDFHGINKPDVPFGASFVCEEDFDPIWSHWVNVQSQNTCIESQNT